MFAMSSCLIALGPHPLVLSHQEWQTCEGNVGQARRLDVNWNKTSVLGKIQGVCIARVNNYPLFSITFVSDKSANLPFALLSH